MKPNKGIVFIIVIITSFSFLINSVNLYFCLTRVEMDTKPEYQIEKNLKSSGFWNLTGSPISIDDNNPSKNWAITAATYNWCSGSGTYLDPYLIENVTIDGQGSGSCIEIINSNDKYFIIRNCTLYRSGSIPDTDGGIKLERVDYGKLVDNNCSNNYANGIRLKWGNNNNISRNILNNNSKCGLQARISYFNIIKSNNVSYNGDGIFLFSSESNDIISDNIINNNYNNGIRLYITRNNKIIDNTIHNNSNSGLSIYEGFDDIIDNNEIYNNNYSGIEIVECNDISILRNGISSNKYGIYLEGQYKNKIFNNEVSLNRDTGIMLLNTVSNNITNNNVNNNEIGLYLENSNDTDIRGNNIINNTDYGLYFVRSNDNKIFDNNVCSNANDYKSKFETPDCEGNIFKKNFCIEDTILPGLSPEIFIIIVISIIILMIIVGMVIYKRKSSRNEKESKKLLSSYKLKKEIRKTEAEMDVEKETHICVVHRGKIVGAIYLCPKCEAYYCIKCAITLKEKGETCWVCDNKIEL